jgi:Uma2 family endonuclease
MIDEQLIAPHKLRPLRRVEYDRMVELGLFADERIELLRGMLVAMTPQSSQHMHTISRLTRWLVPALLDRADVRVQGPLAASEDSEPEPDIAVVPPGDYSSGHPSNALWLIEVAWDSLRKDRILKASIYAEMGVPEYWVFDLKARRLHVYRSPRGGRYLSAKVFGPSSTVIPGPFPDLSLRVREVLPTQRKVDPASR